MENRKKVVMLGGCKEQFDKYRKYPNLDVIVIAAGNDLIDANSAGLQCYEAEPSDTLCCLDIIISNDLVSNLSAVFSFTEFGIETASYIGEVLGVVCNPLKPVVQTRNKHLMRQILRTSYPELTAPFLVTSDVEAVQTFVSEQDLVIIKPIDGAGSKDVCLVSIDSPLPQLTDNMSRFICEKFIGGIEYSVESFSAYGQHQVVAITEKITTNEAPFVELAHIVPASIDSNLDKLISENVIKFLDGIGQTHGPAHTEVKVAGDHVFIIESQTRLGGDRIWKLVEIATGFSFIDAFVERVLMQKDYNYQKKNMYAGIQFFTPEPGKIKEIEIPDDLYSLDDIVEIKISRQVGDIVPSLSSSAERSGFGIICGDSRQRLDILFTELDKIKLDVVNE